MSATSLLPECCLLPTGSDSTSHFGVASDEGLKLCQEEGDSARHAGAPGKFTAGLLGD